MVSVHASGLLWDERPYCESAALFRRAAASAHSERQTARACTLYTWLEATCVALAMPYGHMPNHSVTLTAPNGRYMELLRLDAGSAVPFCLVPIVNGSTLALSGQPRFTAPADGSCACARCAPSSFVLLSLGHAHPAHKDPHRGALGTTAWMTSSVWVSL